MNRELPEEVAEAGAMDSVAEDLKVSKQADTTGSFTTPISIPRTRMPVSFSRILIPEDGSIDEC